MRPYPEGRGSAAMQARLESPRRPEAKTLDIVASKCKNDLHAYGMQHTSTGMNSVTSNDTPLANYPDLSDKVYEAIKSEILSGRAAPGSQLQVVELAKRLGVSRTPVKEALSRIIMEGLVQDLPRKGYFVSKRDSEDITELLDARRMLELVAVERGIHLVEPAEIEQMRDLLGEIDEIIDTQGRYLDYENFVGKDSQFHFLIVGTARNRHLVDAYRHMFLHFHAARMHLSLGSGYRRAYETR